MNIGKQSSLKPTGWKYTRQKAREKQKTIKFKMAARKSIGSELMEEIEKRDYCQYVDLFPRANPMNSTDLRLFRQRTKDRYLVETDQFYSRKGTTKPDGVYKLFGDMVNRSADQVREDLVEWSNRNRNEVTEAGTVTLNHDKKDYAWWILTTTHKKNPVDELSLWGLCKMFFKHAVVYTPDYTWTTLRDKSLDIEEIDKICDIHLAYMGYGKFASITARDSNVTVGAQPTLQTLSVKPKTTVSTPKQPITRMRHGQHPTRTTSAHINYFDLNHGDTAKERKSPRKQKRKSVSELTLRTPSESRLAAQTHISREKDKQPNKQPNKNPDNELDIEITATFSPDEDGMAFTRTMPSKPKLRTTAVPRPKLEKDEQQPPIAGSITPVVKEPNQHPQPPIVQPNTREVKKSNISTTASTTVAEIHVCDKHYHLSQQLLPLLNPATIKCETTSTTNTERDQQTKHEKDEQEKTTLSRITNETTSTTTQLTDNTLHSTDTETRKTIDDTEADEQQAHNIDQQQLREAENQDEMDEHEMQAADGLLMLQELAQFDVPDTEEDENSQLMPIGNAPTTSDPATQIGDLNETTTKDIIENDTNEETSEDTVVYDPPVADLTTSTRDEDAHPVPLPEKDKHANVTLQTESENIAKRKPEKDEQTETQVDEHTEATLQTESENTAKEKPEKDEQTETQEKDKKGTLVIREIGLRKGGTRTDADTIDDTPMPTITSSGKVRCNFCRRDFDTLAEQKQHMTRRHPDQLREQEAKRKREKDERIEREQFKLAIETLKKQEQEKKKKPNKPVNTTSEATKAGKPKVLSKSKRKNKREDGEPPRKKQKIRTQKTTTSTQRRYRCPSDNCNKSYDTQAELNKHHKKSHPPVECPVCKKELPTPNTLDRHMYKHRSTLECQYCDKTFAFQSELELHLIKHEDEPTFFCKSCTRSFMRVGDLREHEESHTGKKHHCTIKGCNFSAPLKRYVRTHIKTTHANKNALPYPCPKCTQKFKFYEQRKRHLANEHH